MILPVLLGLTNISKIWVFKACYLREDLAAQKEREVRYQEGVEAGLQQYYKGVIDELKKKVRDARAQNGNTGT